MAKEELVENSGFPCTTCRKKCRRIHGGNESFYGSLCFFKVLVDDDFQQRLRVPPAFVGKLRDEVGMDEDVVLQSPNCERWTVKLCGTSNGVDFVKGWDKFVHDNGIEFGDFLVFKYACRSFFKVRIFGRSGCEKIELEKNHWVRCPNEVLPTNLDSEEENDKVERNSDQEKNSKTKAFTGGHSSKSPKHCQIPLAGKKPKMETSATTEKTRNRRKSYYASSRGLFTEAERNRTLEAAKSFSSKKPFWLLIMRSMNVSCKFWVNLPEICRRLLKLPAQTTKMILVDSNDKEWHVKYLVNGCKGSFGKGWRIFAQDKNLEAGDVCIFEQMDNRLKKLRVHIFSVAHTCTSHKQMEHIKEMNDSIALETSHSHKKIKIHTNDANKLATTEFGPEHRKDENINGDDAINFATKTFGSEKIKDEKQVQGKDEATGDSESNCLNVTKCMPALLSRKEGSRRSRRIAGLTSLECSNKDIMLSRKITSLDDDDDDVMIIWDSNDASHKIPPTPCSRVQIPYQEHDMRMPISPASNVELEAVSLVVALSSEKATSQAEENV